MPVPETGRPPTAAVDNPALTDAVVAGMHGGARPRVGARAAAALTAAAVVAGFVVLGGMFTSAGGSRQRPRATGAADAQLPGATAGSPVPGEPGTTAARPRPTQTQQAQGQPQGQPPQVQTQPSVSPSLVYQADLVARQVDGGAFTALAGVGCPQGADRGLDVTGRDGGWFEGASGGFYGYGCTGRYLSMPLSGRGTDTGARQQTWWFGTGALTAGSCHVYVFVPAAQDARDTASAVHFAVLPARDGTTLLGEFTVDEQAARDAWADAGWYTLRGATIAVRLTDRGTGRASAGAVLVKCRAG